MSKTSFNAIIRADAGELIGTGHVMRMIALGEALLARGARVAFLTALCPSALADRLRSKGFDVSLLDNCESGDYSDSRQTVAYAVSINAKWIILDGYTFGTAYQTSCRQHGRRVLCVDDHQYGVDWNVDLLLNQNLHAESLRCQYASANKEATLLLGTDFALLRQEFWGGPQAALPRDDGAKRVLVTMGGSDPPNATEWVMQALTRVSAAPLKVTVLVGASNPHSPQLEVICAQHPHLFKILYSVECMPTILGEADCVITAGGSTCWEILWAGKPAAVIAVAANQIPIANSLHEQGLMQFLGSWQDTSSEQLARDLEEWLAGPLTPLNTRAVDGKGARRVAAVLDGKFTITIATASGGWLGPQLESLRGALEADGHRIHLASKAEEMLGGDFLLLLSYWGIVPSSVLDRYLQSLVVHASDLPNGRGWSPATWHILQGNTRLPICLLEASEKVDRGDIYLRDEIHLKGDELIDEWRELISNKTSELCLRFIRTYPAELATRELQPERGTYYPRRKPSDSQLDISKTLAQLFDHLRVVDNKMYPAWFEHLGCRYVLKIEKAAQ